MMKSIVDEKLVSFEELEQKVFQYVCELGCEITKTLLEIYDEELASSRDTKQYRDTSNQQAEPVDYMNVNHSAMQNDLKLGQENNFPEKPETGEKADDGPVLYLVQIACGNGAVGNGSRQMLKPAAAMADKPAQKASLREKLEAYKAQAAGTGKQGIEKAKGKEEML